MPSLFPTLDKDFTDELCLFSAKFDSHIKKVAAETANVIIDWFGIACQNGFSQREFEISLPTQYKEYSVFELDPYTAYEIAASFWKDIIIFQLCFSIKKPDKHKIAAYIFKWINKLRPIQVNLNLLEIVDNSFITKKIMLAAHSVNAKFALAFALKLLNKSKIIEVTKAEFDSIIHEATNKSIPAEQWALMFYFIEKAN